MFELELTFNHVLVNGEESRGIESLLFFLFRPVEKDVTRVLIKCVQSEIEKRGTLSLFF